MKKRTNIIYIWLALPVFFVLIRCGNNSESDVQRINVYEAYNNKHNIELSNISKSVEYVRLETNKKFIVGKAPRVFADDDFLVVISFRKQYVFNRKTGAFICEIGNFGRNPEGYSHTRFNLVYNESKRTVYAANWDGGIIEYSLDGKVLNKIKKQENIPDIASFVCLNDTEYVASVGNRIGNQKEKLVWLNKNSLVTKFFPNTDFFIDNPKSITSRGETEGWFYWFKKELFLQSCFNDTVFKVENNSLTPKYEFELGKYKLDYSQRDFIKVKAWKDYFLIKGTYESENYLFFTLSYNDEERQGIYDKKQKKTHVSDSNNVELFYFDNDQYGFINDIDNFIQYSPTSINQSNELVGLVEAYEIVNWFSKNPEKAAHLSPQLQKLKNIKETDNPVVMVVKLK